MNLVDMIDRIDRAMPGPDKEFFLKMDKGRFPEYHHVFGRWIRNNTGMWRSGTKQFQTDLSRIVEQGYTPDAYTRLQKRKLVENMKGMDPSLDHPDNASHVLMDIYHDVVNFRVTKEDLRGYLG